MAKSFLHPASCTVFSLILTFAIANTAVAEVDLRPTAFGLRHRPEDGIYHRGDSVLISWNVQNFGDEASSSYTVEIYAGGYLIGSDTYSGLGPGQADIGVHSPSCTLPDSIPLGDYTISMEVTCSNDDDPGNNSETAGDITVAEKKAADLYLQELTVSNRPHNNIYHPGDSVDVTASIENIGDEPAGPFTADVYAGDHHIGSSTEESVTLFHVSCTLPDSIALGDYTIRMEITCSNDRDPSNNSASDSSPITVGPLASDLWIEHVELTNEPPDALFHPGESIAVLCRVRNVGQAASDSYTADFYIDDYFLGSVERGSVGVGETDIFTESWELAEDIPEGYYTPNVSITCSNDDDTRGGDNWNRNGLFRFARKVNADVSIQSIDAADGIYHPGDSIAVNVALRSTGGQLASSCDIAFYASADATISVDDYRIQSASIGSLHPGDSYNFDIICQFPGDIPLGQYYVGIIATYPSGGELQTSTSYDEAPVSVGVPPDLSVQSVDAPDGTYSSGDQIKVHSLIKNIGERTSTDYRVNYYLSRDGTITTGDYNIGHADRAALPPGEQHSYEATCRIPSNLSVGNYYVGVIVTCSNDYNPDNNVKRDGGTILISQPTDVVAGRATYQDRDGGEHPIRYALVEICDGGTDTVLKTTYTDGSGNYSVRVPADGTTGRDVYVKVRTEGVSGAYPGTTSAICSVRDKRFREIYRLQSEICHNPAGSPLTVDLVAPKTGGEFMVFDSVVEGFHKAKEFFGIEMETVTVFWPNLEAYSYYDPCEVELYVSQDDRGDRDVIIHEYGHYFTQVNDFAKGDVGEYAGHYWNADLRYRPSSRTQEQARNMAFREAWASLYSIVVQYGETWYPYSGDAIYHDLDEESGWMLEADLEWDADPDYSPGEYFENMNACVLWDIFDEPSASESHFDRLSDPGLEKIWLVSRYYKPDDILQFWDGWCENYGFDDNIQRIFKMHQMPYGNKGYQVPENRPPIADAGEDQTVLQTCEWGAWVTLSGSGYDPDGEEVVCSWSADAVHRTRSDDGTEMSAVFSVGTTTATFKVRDYQYIHEVTDTVEITVIATDADTWTEPCF